MISKEVYMELHAMRREGQSLRALARARGLHSETVRFFKLISYRLREELDDPDLGGSPRRY